MKNRLSPIEELRAERLRLNIDISRHEERLKSNLNYAKNNWGSLLLSSVSPFSGSKRSFSNFITSDNKKTNTLSTLYNKVSAVAPTIFEIAQPILIGLLTKRVSSFFLGNKNKKNKKKKRKKKFFGLF